MLNLWLFLNWQFKRQSSGKPINFQYFLFQLSLFRLWIRHLIWKRKLIHFIPLPLSPLSFALITKGDSLFFQLLAFKYTQIVQTRCQDWMIINRLCVYFNWITLPVLSSSIPAVQLKKNRFPLGRFWKHTCFKIFFSFTVFSALGSFYALRLLQSTRTAPVLLSLFILFARTCNGSVLLKSIQLFLPDWTLFSNQSIIHLNTFSVDIDDRLTENHNFRF